MWAADWLATSKYVVCSCLCGKLKLCDCVVVTSFMHRPDFRPALSPELCVPRWVNAAVELLLWGRYFPFRSWQACPILGLAVLKFQQSPTKAHTVITQDCVLRSLWQTLLRPLKWRTATEEPNLSHSSCLVDTAKKACEYCSGLYYTPYPPLSQAKS